MESSNPLSNVAWTGPFNPCVHFPWLWKSDKYPDQALWGKVLLTHLETLLKDTRLGNTPKQMKSKKSTSLRSRVEDIHSLNSCDKVLLGHYCFKELLCGHYQLSSLELLAMIWTGSWKPQSNSLVACKAWGQGGVVRWVGVSGWMLPIDGFDMQNILAVRFFTSEKVSCFFLTRCAPSGPTPHTTPPVWLLKVFLYACDLDQTFLWSCAHHFAVIWHMRDSHTYTTVLSWVFQPMGCHTENMGWK